MCILAQHQERLLQSGSLLHPANRKHFEDTLESQAEEDVRRELVHLQRAKATVTSICSTPRTARRPERRQQEHESAEPEPHAAHTDAGSDDPPESRGAMAVRTRAPCSARVTHRLVSCEVSSFRDPLAGAESSGTTFEHAADKHVMAQYGDGSDSPSSLGQDPHQDPLRSFSYITGTLEALTERAMREERQEAARTHGAGRGQGNNAPHAIWRHTSAPASAQVDAQAARKPGGARGDGTPAGLLDAFLRLLDGGADDQGAASTPAGPSYSREAELCAALADVPGLRPVQVERAQHVRSFARAQPASGQVSSRAEGRMAFVARSQQTSWVGLEVDAAPPHQVLQVLHVQDVHRIRQGQPGLWHVGL